ncbi:MAG: hypothetical protein IKI75_00675 [Lachnospiraceae bacterium]|nr:hypothetical protein [Lachnospiraceae bacterium]
MEGMQDKKKALRERVELLKSKENADTDQLVQAQMQLVLGERDDHEKHYRTVRLKAYNDAAAETAWMRQREIPKDKADSQITSVFSKLHLKKSFFRSELDKQSKRMAEAAGLQGELFLQEHAFEQAEDTGVFKAAVNFYKSGNQQFLQNADEDAKYGDLLREFGAYASLQQEGTEAAERTTTRMNRLLMTMSVKNTQELGLEEVLKEAAETDLSEFEYKSDKEFVDGYPARYAKLKALCHANEIFRLSEIHKIDGVNMTVLRAKLDVMEQIRNDYETRIKMMHSPYYALLAGKDFESLSVDQLDEKIKLLKGSQEDAELGKFLDNVKSLRGKGRFVRGANATELGMTTLKTFQEKDHADSMKEIDGFAEMIEKYKKIHNTGDGKGTPDDQARLFLGALKFEFGEERLRKYTDKLYKTLFDMDQKNGNQFYSKEDLDKIRSWEATLTRALQLQNENNNDENGDEDVKETEKALADKASMYADIYKEKDRLMKESIKRCFKDDPEIVKQLYGGNGARSIMLMKPGKDGEAYNDKVMKFQYKRILRNELVQKKAKLKADFSEEDEKKLAGLQKELAKESEELAVPYLKKVIDTDIGGLYHLDGDELVAKQAEIIELTMACMMLSDIAKEEFSDIEGFRVKDKLLGKPDPALQKTDPKRYAALERKFQAMQQAFTLKMAIMEPLRAKCRGAAILKYGDLLEDPIAAVSSSELKHLDEKLTPRGQMAAFAKKEYEKGKKNISLAEMTFMSLPHVKAYLSTEAESAELAIGYLPPVHKGAEYAGRASALIEQRIKEAKEKGQSIGSKEAAAQLYSEAKAKNDAQTMFELEVYHKLHAEKYILAGDTEPMIREPIFRSFSSSESVSTIRKMSQDDYDAMLKDLSAGAFPQQMTEEEKKAAKEQNLRGLRTYYDNVRGHYEALEKKYGYELPDMPWLIMHLDEVVADFANVQVDNDLVDHDPGVLKDENAQDLRLKHLIRFYNTFGGAITNPMKNGLIAAQKGQTLSSLLDFANKFLATANADKTFLKGNPVTD